jgi:hypothetical protein
LLITPIWKRYQRKSKNVKLNNLADEEKRYKWAGVFASDEKLEIAERI